MPLGEVVSLALVHEALRVSGFGQHRLRDVQDFVDVGSIPKLGAAFFDQVGSREFSRFQKRHGASQPPAHIHRSGEEIFIGASTEIPSCVVRNFLDDG